MSPTPRTDKVQVISPESKLSLDYVVPAEFAAQLEIELNQVNELNIKTFKEFSDNFVRCTKAFITYIELFGPKDAKGRLKTIINDIK